MCSARGMNDITKAAFWAAIVGIDHPEQNIGIAWRNPAMPIFFVAYDRAGGLQVCSDAGAYF